MKKVVIAASACFVAGLIGCTISLPMVAKDVIHLLKRGISQVSVPLAIERGERVTALCNFARMVRLPIAVDPMH